MNIFVTGHRGYIGSLLVEVLKEAGHRVTGCDLGLFDRCIWSTLTLPDKELAIDVRDLSVGDLEGQDCVMHLAAISNDPMGDIDERVTLSINRDATLQLAKMAKTAGVSRFLFASSCSIYGKQEGESLNESSAVLPQSVYARSKIEAEQGLLALASDCFSPTCLRNATAYGLSPKLRLDLVANDLLASAHMLGEIRMNSDGSAYRPLIHAKDIARAFLAFLNAPRSLIHAEVVNIGSHSENYQVREIAKAVFGLMPHAKVVFLGGAATDPRNYRVNFDKLYRLLPDFTMSYTLNLGLEELYRAFCERPLTRHEYDQQQFVRLSALKKEKIGKETPAAGGHLFVSGRFGLAQRL